MLPSHQAGSRRGCQRTARGGPERQEGAPFSSPRQPQGEEELMTGASSLSLSLSCIFCQRSRPLLSFSCSFFSVFSLQLSPK
ncbi:hypothetical protein V5799_022537 [Amblyomma americanum]|uniref:Uncharacterized protein n=1 Tax=Amblyomma americanum TaxID=6943 RepID=A0AAQ4FK88_AMBAM